MYENTNNRHFDYSGKGKTEEESQKKKDNSSQAQPQSDRADNADNPLAEDNKTVQGTPKNNKFYSKNQQRERDEEEDWDDDDDDDDELSELGESMDRRRHGTRIDERKDPDDPSELSK